MVACATTQTNQTLANAVAEFDKAVQSAKAALEAEQKSRPRVRRIEAIEYYIATRKLVGSEVAVQRDLVSSDPVGSFSRYVCAGSSSFAREQNAFAFVSRYSTGASDIFSPGTSSAEGQIARFRALREPIAIDAVAIPPTSKKAADCVAKVAATLGSWRPVPTTDGYDENPVAVLSAAVAAYQALDKFLTTALTNANNQLAKEKLKLYVNQWDSTFKQVITQGLADDKLTTAWSHRAAVSLQPALRLFQTIFSLPDGINLQDDNERIRQIGSRVNDMLGEYDAIATAVPPQNISKALLEAEGKLVALANDDKLTASQFVTYFESLSSDLNTLQKQYGDVDTAVKALRVQVTK